MSYKSDARARLSAVFLLALPASLLGACGDDVTNHYYNYYGEGGAEDGPPPTGTGGKLGGTGGKTSTSGSAGMSGAEDGGMPSGGGDGAGGDGSGPVVDPNYPDAPLDDTPTTEQELKVFEIGNRYWFGVSDEQREKMNNRWGGGPGGGGDPYQPGSSGLTTFVDHLWATTAGEDPQTSHYGKVQVKVVGESTWRQWDEFSIPNLNIDADQFVKNQRIGGYEHLRFNNGQVGTIFRERLTAELFRRFDYPAPLATYAWVESNVWGPGIQIPYVLVERYKRKFCERYADDFGGGCANMWEFVGDFLAYGHFPGPMPGGYAGDFGMEPNDQPSIFDVPDNCQLDTCDNTRVKQLEAKLAQVSADPPEEGFKAAMSEFIDWTSFHRFQCLSWMLWIGDDTLHNNNNVVIVERADGLFQYLPYSIDISLGQDWYQNTPLPGDNHLARGCQGDESCWADTIATCEGMIEEFEAMKPRDILKAVYDELDEHGMLRPGDDNRYETLDNWFVQRLEVLSDELEYYRDPRACHYPQVDCGGWCDYPEYCPQQCVPPDPKPPVGEGGAGPIIIDPGMGGSFAAGGAGNVAGSFGMAGMAMGGDGGGPEPCPEKEEYRIAR